MLRTRTSAEGSRHASTAGSNENQNVTPVVGGDKKSQRRNQSFFCVFFAVFYFYATHAMFFYDTGSSFYTETYGLATESDKNKSHMNDPLPMRDDKDTKIATGNGKTPLPLATAENRTESNASQALEQDNSTSTQATDNLSITLEYNEEEYEKVLNESLKSLPNVTTGVFTQYLFSGLNNQLRTFTGFMFMAHDEGIGQLIEQSFKWKDQFGKRYWVPHKKLWDVVHWNTFYPILPRFVSYDKDLHPDIDVKPSNGKKDVRFKEHVASENYTTANPRQFVSHRQQGWFRNGALQKAIAADRVGDEGQLYEQAKMNESILKGALRPHPFLQSLVDKEIERLRSGGKIMTIHLRVEPDMARQNRVCWDKKVYNASEIIDAIHAKFPEPPVNTVLIQFSRDLMEHEARRRKSEGDDVHHLNDRNLKEINRILKEGMWGGKVKVFEAGTELVKNTGHDWYGYFSEISGAIVNLYLGIQSDIFVGTEVSTYSSQAVNSRFYRDLQDSYFYRPDGLHEATSKPHVFGC